MRSRSRFRRTLKATFAPRNELSVDERQPSVPQIPAFPDASTHSNGNLSRSNIDVSTISLDSGARLYSNLSKKALDGRAVRYSYIRTIAPNSASELYSHLVTVSRNSIVRRSRDVTIVPENDEALREIVIPTRLSDDEEDGNGEGVSNPSECGALRYREISTEARDSGAVGYSHAPTQPPNNEALRHSDVPTEAPDCLPRTSSDALMRPAHGTAYGLSHRKTQEPIDAENEEGNENSGEGRTTGPTKTFADGIYQRDDCEEDEITAAPPNTIDCVRGELRESLRREEQLRFGYNFIFGHTDAALSKVLKGWGQRVSETKPERIARVYLVFRGYILSGSNAADIFAQCRRENGHAKDRSRGNSLFKDFKRWLQMTHGTPHTSTVVPAEAVLMRNFPLAEIDHLRENEARVEAERQIVRDGVYRPVYRGGPGV